MQKIGTRPCFHPPNLLAAWFRRLNMVWPQDAASQWCTAWAGIGQFLSWSSIHGAIRCVASLARSCYVGWWSWLHRGALLSGIGKRKSNGGVSPPPYTKEEWLALAAKKVRPGALQHSDGAKAYHQDLEGVERDYVSHSTRNGGSYFAASSAASSSALAGTQSLDGWWGRAKRNLTGITAANESHLDAWMREAQWRHWLQECDRFETGGTVVRYCIENPQEWNQGTPANIFLWSHFYGVEHCLQWEKTKRTKNTGFLVCWCSEIIVVYGDFHCFLLPQHVWGGGNPIARQKILNK